MPPTWALLWTPAQSQGWRENSRSGFMFSCGGTSVRETHLASLPKLTSPTAEKKCLTRLGDTHVAQHFSFLSFQDPAYGKHGSPQLSAITLPEAVSKMGVQACQIQVSSLPTYLHQAVQAGFCR